MIRCTGFVFGVAGVPPVATSSPPAALLFLRLDARRAGPSDDGDRPSPPARKKRRVCAHHSSSSAENAFGPSAGGIPSVSSVSDTPNVFSHADFSSDHTVLYFAHKVGEFMKIIATAQYALVLCRCVSGGKGILSNGMSFQLSCCQVKMFVGSGAAAAGTGAALAGPGAGLAGAGGEP